MRKPLLWISVPPLLLLMAWTALWLRQWQFRRHAEQLHADVLNLHINGTTKADAESLVHRWQHWSTTVVQCKKSSDCEYIIELNNQLPDAPQFVYEDSPHVISRMFDHLGLRSSRASARVLISQGTVSEKSLGLDVSLPTSMWHRNQTYWPALEAGFIERDQPGLHSSDGASDHHYIHYRRIRLEALFTTEESEATQRAFTDLRFECITRWRPCLREDQIAPGIWQLLKTD